MEFDETVRKIRSDELRDRIVNESPFTDDLSKAFIKGTFTKPEAPTYAPPSGYYSPGCYPDPVSTANHTLTETKKDFAKIEKLLKKVDRAIALAENSEELSPLAIAHLAVYDRVAYTIALKLETVGKNIRSSIKAISDSCKYWQARAEEFSEDKAYVNACHERAKESKKFLERAPEKVVEKINDYIRRLNETNERVREWHNSRISADEAK